MKKIVLSLAVILTLGVANSWAQNTVTPETGVTLSKDGLDKAGADHKADSEATDYVTVGSTIKYFVMPDENLNPGFFDAVATPNYDWSKVLSNFTWTLDGTTDVSTNYVKTSPNSKNYIQIAIPAPAGSHTLQVTESAPTGACVSDPTTINIEAIKYPEISYPAADGINYYCANGADGALTVGVTQALSANFSSWFPFTRNVEVVYEITSPTGFTTVSNTASLTETDWDNTSGAGTGTFSIPEKLTHYGTYTVTLKTVSDEISRKSFDDALEDNAAAGNTTFTLVVYKTQTGAIYHVPNL